MAGWKGYHEESADYKHVYIHLHHLQLDLVPLTTVVFSSCLPAEETWILYHLFPLHVHNRHMSLAWCF